MVVDGVLVMSDAMPRMVLSTLNVFEAAPIPGRSIIILTWDLLA